MSIDERVGQSVTQNTRRNAVARSIGREGRAGQMVNCQKCAYFYVTWDPSFPRGCRLYGFKTATQPSATVFEATGGECQNYVSRVNKKRA